MASATSSAEPSYSYHQYYNRRLSRSLQRYTIDAPQNQYTLLAREFFSLHPSQTLPRRLIRLARGLSRLTEHPDKDDYLPVHTSHDPTECRRVALAAAVFALAPPSFLDDCRELFEALLEDRRRQWEHSSHEDDNDTAATNTSGDRNNHPWTLHPDEQDEFYRALAQLGFVSNQLHNAFRSSLGTVMARTVHSLIGSDFESEGMLHQCIQWKNDVLAPWVRHVVGHDAYRIHRWEDQLQYTVYETFVRVRMGELFELVTEYPESLPAVRELSEALDGTGRLFYHSLAGRWRSVLVQRLLHPGAQTSQIIDVYISTIKVLREMDPSGELLQVVTGPVGEYLRGREDTVRCIVSSLTDEEGGGDLYEELHRKDAKSLEEAQLDEEDEEEDPPSLDWEPPPSILRRRGVISGQVGTVTSSSRRAGDILSMLVGIYGSRELFVNEYRIMLADKLLSNLQYDTDKEVHKVELLKLRFGEASMSQCEVMIKDIEDSKRIYANICSTLTTSEDHAVVDAAIVSHIFWPTFQKEHIVNHPRIQAQLDKFGDQYAKLKNPRRLVWMNQLGTVELNIEVYETDEEGNSISHVKEISCTPVHATLLAHFEDKTYWTVEELSNVTELSEEMIRKRMGFWVNQHVVQATRSGYSLVSAKDADSNEQIFLNHDDDEDHSISLGGNEEEEIKVYESYIFGMLSNLGQLPLDRIHTMLKTFAAGSDHKYDKTPQQLAVFLKQLCKEEKLEYSPDGLYKLLKKRS